MNDRFAVTLLAGTQGMKNNFAELGPMQQFVHLSDFIVRRDELDNFGSRFDDAILAAVRPGDGQLWYRLGLGWTDFASAEVELSEDESEFTITAIDQNQLRHTGTLPISDARVSILGRVGDGLIVRLLGNAETLELQPAPG